tara:strand:+ start:1951 stop:2349 length:399 start_codon:yes stop_codon:yes gene_type:complete
MTSVTTDRTTKYITSLRAALAKKGHATNAELLAELQLEYPELSATTVHRITARMVERGETRLAPAGENAAMRFDALATPHDHFMCTKCGKLRDAHLGEIIRQHIEATIGDGCSISGDLTVTGVCKDCKNKEE